VHPEDRARLQAAFVAARGGAPLETELRLQASPTLERWVAMRGHRTEIGGRSVAGTMVDVTALKRREATLTHTALMFESFLDGVVLTDQGGRIVDLNSAMARLFGLVRTAAVGKSLFPAVALDDPDRQLSDAYAAMAATGRWTTTLEQGPSACFEVLAFPLRTDHGESIGAIWMFRDVSEKQRMAAQIVFLDRLASLGTLSAGIAHEINNPLMFILGNAEFVRDGLASQDHESSLQALNDIIEGAQRISSIVRDLKAFSQANPDAKTQAIDVRRAIEIAIKMAGGVVRAHAHLVTEIGPISHAAASESRLVQVLVNLLMNAAQSIPEGRGGATITIRTSSELDGVTIEITDTGKGMTPEILARVFEPFFTTKPLVGTGLGLSICHGLVTAMGGTIALRSTEGEGTTASIWLRAAADPRADAPPPEPVLAHRRLRVLVVDDEPVLLRTAVRVLADHEVVVADGYASAVERLRQRREVFDVILCDLMMPDGTGMDLHAWLVAERPELVARVVFVTGGAFTDRAREFLHTTGNHKLQKPVDHATLRRAVLEAGRHPIS
jgi:PAS domain S-box-containing protein